ncbi:hypothetical protein Clacol_006758 [Clathrus columnatus]|uniref:MTHFR SAM-binding regulatory domain-containing protein n=1 Tax=Clathrus columnatus TaxID=1419009 RepID=A0AAV5AI12_9AGAM|nr:hypothetical protein Clacol_006758 [Clathrus columnatus]
MSELRPMAISITWGAGGSTKDRSLELAGLTQSEYGVETILHLTCTNIQKGAIEDTLREAKQLGIQNILALRGGRIIFGLYKEEFIQNFKDPPRGTEHWIPTDPQFVHAQDLVEYIRASDEFSKQFCIGVAGYPEGHPDKEVNEEEELEYLKRKVDAGADFIITQLFYDHDDQEVKNYGIELSMRMIEKLRSDGEVHAFHFCTLNLEKSVRKVLEGLCWTGKDMDNLEQNKLISDNVERIPKIEGDLAITPHEASVTATHSFQTGPASDTGSIGKGEINHAATWDEFPNGRFGDFKSPAYGVPNLWDGGLGVKPSEARSRWGCPKTMGDLTECFLAYLHSKTESTPFSLTPLSPEAVLIMHYLENLTKRGWWTVGSQPAIDAAPSEDELIGWGPRNGYIFQKAFVEFFAESHDVQRLKERIQKHGCGMITFLASNLHGDYETNMSDEGTNAVTWGVFPGHEIAQSTIIERENFLSWKTEAFSIWLEWAHLYPPDSEEHRLLDKVRKTRWLVSVIHHDYKAPAALWEFLLKDETG